MKKILSLFLSISMLFSIGAGLELPAFAEISGEFEYQILSDGTAEISKYKGNSSEVIIPAELDGYQVTSLGDHSFFYNTNLLSVTIPDGVTSIGGSAFMLCLNLTHIQIPDSVTTIGWYAFSNCRVLTELKIPENIAEIGYNAFDNSGFYRDDSFWENDVLYIDGCLVSTRNTLSGVYEVADGTRLIAVSAFADCKDMTGITIPNSVKHIGVDVFKGCSSLTGVNIKEDNQNFVFQEGILFNKNKTKLIQYLISNEAASYTVPDSVEIICDYAFERCENLTEVIITDTVTHIGEHSFSYCKNLISVTIPNSVTSIGDYAFNYCTDLTDVAIPDSAKSIGGWAFTHCENLKSIEIPYGISVIEDGLFSYCRSLSSVLLPESVTSIGRSAFDYCTDLAQIAILDSVTNIGSYVFSYCSSLTDLEIPDSVKSIGESAFDRCILLNSIKIPDGVSSIENRTFTDCYNLKSIIIPKSIASIDFAAFDSCDKLTDVYYYGTEDSWNKMNINNQDNRNKSLLNANIHFLGKTYTVTIDKSNFGYVSINGNEAADGISMNFEEDEKITLKAVPYENARFVGWIANGVTTVSTDSIFETTVLANVTYTPVFAVENNTQITVTFVDAYGNVVDSQVVSSANDIVIPAAPNRAGYKFATSNGWSLTDDEISKLTASAVISVKYVKESSKLFKVTANNCDIKAAGKSFTNEALDIGYDTLVTITNDNAKAWKINGATVAYGSSYTFFVGSDIELTPVFEAVNAAPVAAGVSISEVTTDITRASFLATRYMTDDYVCVNSGYIYGAGNLGEITLGDVDGQTVKAVYNKTDAKQFSLTFGLKAQAGTMTARAFLAYVGMDNGSTKVVYAEPQTYTYDN